MSPLLESETYISDASKKFVRKDEKIAFEDADRSTHIEIAIEYGLLNENGTVDDAGYMEGWQNELEFLYDSTTCQVDGDPVEARVKTMEIGQEVMGADIVVSGTYKRL